MGRFPRGSGVEKRYVAKKPQMGGDRDPPGKGPPKTSFLRKSYHLNKLGQSDKGKAEN